MNTTKTAKHLRSFWRKDLGLLAPSQLEALGIDHFCLRSEQKCQTSF